MTQSDTFLLLTPVYRTRAWQSVRSRVRAGEMKVPTSTKGYVKNELLRLEELLDVATCRGPVPDRSAKGRSVDGTLIVCQGTRYLRTLDEE
jgi:hypothetical protein